MGGRPSQFPANRSFPEVSATTKKGAPVQQSLAEVLLRSVHVTELEQERSRFV